MLLTSTGVYTDTLQNVNGCDSLVSLDITFNTGSSDTTATSTCDPSYNFNGMLLTSSGVYTDTLQNVNGCDSLVSLDITFNTGSSDTTATSTCDPSYNFNGMLLTSTGVYTDTLQNVNGCDSLVSLDITFNTASSDTLVVEECSVPYMVAGLIINSTGIYKDTLINAVGCDSVLTVDFTLLLAPRDTSNVFSCNDNYITLSGKILNGEGYHEDTLTTASGCDSIVVYNLTVATDQTPTASVQGVGVVVPNIYDTYQWFSCADSTKIVGATSALYEPGEGNEGEFYVLVTIDGCAYSSPCIYYDGIGVEENEVDLQIYPNPITDQQLFVRIDNRKVVKYSIFDLTGKMVQERGVTNYSGAECTIEIGEIISGMYFLRLEFENGNYYQNKILVE
jgi:hypothetical protein